MSLTPFRDALWKMLLAPSKNDPTKTNAELVADLLETHKQSSKRDKEKARQLRAIVARHKSAPQAPGD